jgi:hypothetical protein
MGSRKGEKYRAIKAREAAARAASLGGASSSSNNGSGSGGSGEQQEAAAMGEGAVEVSVEVLSSDEEGMPAPDSPPVRDNSGQVGGVGGRGVEERWNGRTLLSCLVRGRARRMPRPRGPAVLC